MLYRFKLKETNTCDICLIQIEDKEHLFWECDRVKNLWYNFQTWWEGNSGKKFDKPIDLKQILYGIPCTSFSNILYNLFLIIIKRYIYVNKSNYNLTLENALEEIQKIKEIEKNIAGKNNSMINFLKKWENIN